MADPEATRMGPDAVSITSMRPVLGTPEPNDGAAPVSSAPMT